MGEPRRSPSHPLFAAAYDPLTALAERTVLSTHRRYLVDGLSGRVLLVGAGTGATLPYLASASDVERPIRAVEPDRHMRRRARDRARELGLDVDLRGARAEDLPYADGAFDAVIASMVFCTIPDVERALSEAVRVLRPGGELRFLEHVADDGWRGRLQRIVDPLWTRIAGGCHLHRRTGTAFAARPALDVVEMERRALGITPVRPFVRGRLRKRR